MTIKDIARESGYSVGTVSRTLNNAPGVSDKTRKRILEIVEKYGFELNRNAKHLKQQGKDGIAVIIKGKDNMFFVSVVQQLQKRIEEKGHACLVSYISEEDDEVEQALRLCQERNPYGILFLGSNKAPFQKSFARIQVPCVMVTNSADDFGFDHLSSVSTDDETAADYAVEHLISLGHRRIGILSGIFERSRAADSRYQGALKAFERHGISFDGETGCEKAHFEVEEGYYAMKRLMRKMPDITAVFAMADVLAIGAIRAIRDQGLRVPEDISVIGFDGLELGNYLVPRLTTIHQDSTRIAVRSVEILLDNIDNGYSAVHEKEPFYLVPGESVCRIENK